METIFEVPYIVQSNSRVYHYVFLYQIINGIHVLVKMLNSHIFMVYVPDTDQEYIKRLFKESEMKQLSKIVFEKYICIRSDFPYCQLGMLYMETLSNKFSYSIKQNGHDGKLTELDIFSILNMYWKTYYNDNSYNLLRNPTSEMYNQYNLSELITHNPTITLFNAPYNFKENKYLKLQEFLGKII